VSITAKDIRKFERAALQRQAAAELLLEHGYHLDATYLAGYVVELALKALILRRTPKNARDSAWESITAAGAKGHSLEYLKHLLNKTGCSVPREMTERLRVVAWSTDLRYEVGLIAYDDAKAFLDAARQIRQWAERG
jgi:HEPN domain-containing protein